MPQPMRLFGVFRILADSSKIFVGFTQAQSPIRAISQTAFVKLVPITSLQAEIATPEMLKRYNRKSKANPKVVWRVYDGDRLIGNPTEANTAEEAARNVWYGIVKPDENDVTKEQKDWLRTLTSKPIFGQENKRHNKKRKKKPRGQKNLFGK